MSINNKITRRIFLWTLIYLILTTVIAFALHRYLIKLRDTEVTFFYLFTKTIIVTFSIGILATPIGYIILHLLNQKPNLIRIPAVLFSIIFATIAGNKIGCDLIVYVFNMPAYKIKLNDLFLNLLLVVIFTIITIITEDNIKKRNKLVSDLDAIKGNINTESADQTLSVKDDRGYHTIRFGDLIYLSSHGKKSAYHTIESVYTVNQLLKDISEKLPSELFIRIHKQFIVNINFLKRVRYYEGGRYTAYLNDEDETVIPMGRNLSPLIKEKFGI